MSCFAKKFIYLLATVVVIPAALMAQGNELTFKKLKNKKDLTIKNCPIVDGESRVKVDAGGKEVSLVSLKNRDSYSLGKKKFKYFACDTLGNLYAKKKTSDTATLFDVSLTDFPKVENNLGKACKNVKSWPGSHIYKTIGSHHFTDVRRNTIGLIVRRGGSGPFPGCIDVVDSNGEVVAKMGRYATNERDWAARFYAGVGCGGGTPFNGSAIASRAKKSSGNTKIYMDVGTTCLGPIEANKCIGSAQC